MNKMILCLSVLFLGACSSGGGSGPQTFTEEEPIVLAPYQSLANGLPVVKKLEMGNLPKSKTKKIKIKNNLDVDMVFTKNEEGELQSGFVTNEEDSAYSYTTDCPESLAPNQMCEFRITVDPDKSRARDLKNVFYININNARPEEYAFGNAAFVVEIISQITQNPIVTDLAADLSVETYISNAPSGITYEVIVLRNELSLAVRDVKINLPAGYSFSYSSCSDVLEPGEICEAAAYYSGQGPTPSSSEASVTATGSSGAIIHTFDITQTFFHSSVVP